MRRLPTLEEFLASILLEESFVGDRTGEVVHHQLEYWLDRLFGIASIVSQSWVLYSVRYIL
jgi:hypothetical protein